MAGGRTGRGLNGNPVQSGGLNRERLYRAGYSPPRADQMGGRTGRGLNGNPMQEVNFIHHFVDLVEPFLCYVLISAQYLCPLLGVGPRC